MILSFDTATKQLSVALERDGEVLSNCETNPNGHAVRLMPLIDELLTEAQVDRRDLETIVVGLGPGSFTGIRIGLATALGLAAGLSIPVYGVSSLEARLTNFHGLICPIIDARRDRVYAGFFLDGQPIGEEQNLPFLEVLDLLERESGPIGLIGEEIETFVPRARERLGERLSLLDVGNYARGALEAFKRGRFTEDIVPRYLREAQAEAERLGLKSE